VSLLVRVATSTHVQSTVVGQVGVGGVHAVNPVEKAHNNVSERALTHVLLMGGEIVITAYAIEDKPATHNRALSMVVGLVGLYRDVAA